MTSRASSFTQQVYLKWEPSALEGDDKCMQLITQDPNLKGEDKYMQTSFHTAFTFFMRHHLFRLFHFDRFDTYSQVYWRLLGIFQIGDISCSQRALQTQVWINWVPGSQTIMVRCSESKPIKRDCHFRTSVLLKMSARGPWSCREAWRKGWGTWLYPLLRNWKLELKFQL